MGSEKKEGISLVMLVLIIISIILVITIVINLIKENSANSKIESAKGNDNKSKFSLEMMSQNNLGQDISQEQFKKKFPGLVNSDSYVDTSTGKNIDEYTAKGITVVFENNKISTIMVLSGETSFSFNGIKVGDSKDSVINSFYSEKKDEKVKDSDGNEIGSYLYGNYFLDNIESIKITDRAEYAYVGNETTAAEGYYDYVIEYGYMEPPYIEENASLKDTVAILQIGIKDEKVVTMAFQVKPLA